jgi:hypothetical protein
MGASLVGSKDKEQSQYSIYNQEGERNTRWLEMWMKKKYGGKGGLSRFGFLQIYRFL